MNILIAEDMPLFQAAHAFSMKRWGFAYDMAGNGVEAVNYAKANIARYDLCIMDVEMPMMDGIEAVRTLRRSNGVRSRIVTFVRNSVGEQRGQVGRIYFKVHQQG